jgi:hypothetical protein
MPIINPPTAPHSSSSIIRGWYNMPLVTDVPRKKKEPLKSRHTTLKVNWFILSDYEDTVSNMEVIWS